MNIHPDTVQLPDHYICKKYVEYSDWEMKRYGKRHYPTLFNMNVSKENFLYIIPLLYKMITSKKVHELEIPQHIINEVKSGNGKIMFDSSFEFYNLYVMDYFYKNGTSWASNTLEIILNTIKKYNLSKNQVVLVTSNINNYQQDYPFFKITSCMPLEQLFNTKNFNESHNTYIMNNKNLTEQRCKRNYRVLSTMGTIRLHKLLVAKHIYDNNFLDKNLASLYRSYDPSVHPQSLVSRMLPEISNDFIKSFPWILDTEEQCYPSENGQLVISPEIYNFYLDSYVELCVDTFFEESEMFLNTNQITEKVYRPILAQKPFIVCGFRGCLEYLHDLGYKTFGHLWDESYDKLSSTERLNSLINLYDKFNQCSDTEMAEICKKAMPIVEHNYYQYIENLSNKTYLRYFKV